jgi:L-arabinose isomerase
MKFGFSVSGFGVGDLAARVSSIPDEAIDEQVSRYEAEYQVSPDLRHDGRRAKSVRVAARIELGLRAFLQEGGFKGFTTTFEDLHGLAQLPGLAPQRLMADGYGFAAEGDWKTAALLRALKVMAAGRAGGTSFMEDYTYHLTPGASQVLGAHMLEICPSIAAATPSLEVHPLGIGGKADPARLVFDAPAGPALNVSLIDLGNRFRLVLNEVDVVAPAEPMPRLPVARALWQPRPSFESACACWIHAGGAHHTVFSQAVTTEMLEDFASMAGVELAVIDAGTRERSFRRELEWNEIAYGLKNGFVA